MHKTKTVKRVLAEGTLAMTASKFLSQAVAIGYLFVVLSELSVFEYGLVKLAFSIPMLLGVFNLVGLNAVLVSDLVSMRAEGDVEKQRYLFSSAFSLKMMLGVLTSTGLFLSTYILQDFFSPDTLNMIRLLCLMLFFGQIRSFIVLSFTVLQRFSSLAIMSTTEELLKFTILVTLLLGFGWGPIGVIAATVFTDLLIIPLFFFGLLSLRNSWLEGKFFSKGVFDPLYAIKDHALWSVFLGGLRSFVTNIRPWIIQFVLGTQAVGIYALALALVQPLSKLIPISQIINPAVPLYKDRPASLTRLVNAAIKYKLLAQLALFVGVAILLPTVLLQFFPDYKNAYPLFLALALAFTPVAFLQMFNTVFYAFKEQRNLFLATAINLALIVMTLPILLYFFGLYGVAIELLITQIVFLVSRYRLVKKLIPDYSFSLRSLVTFNEFDRLIIKRAKEYAYRPLSRFKKV